MGIRVIPAGLRAQIGGGTGDFRIAGTRGVGDAASASRVVAAVGVGANDLTKGESIELVPTGVSRWQKWNRDGQIVARKDLPRVDKSFGGWLSPNFGDYSKGTHVVSQVRKVYQKEVRHGKQMRLVVNLDQSATVLSASCEWVSARSDHDPHDLLMAASLVSEALGGSRPHAVPAQLTRQQWEATLAVNWTILPPGTKLTPSELLDRLTIGAARMSANRDVALERIETIQATNPGTTIIGASGSDRYVGFKYADDLVVMENFNYGNALYVLYEDWAEVSKRSRTDLLAQPDRNFDRIVHTSGWGARLANILRMRGHAV